MEEDSPIKEILYDVIKEIPEKEIQILFESGNQSKLIENLFEKTLPRINTISGDINEKLGILSESVSHYILTEMLIPSQRKIIYKDIELDIIVPELSVLKNRSEDAIIIYFAKSSNIEKIQKKINELQKIQKNTKNIWVVLHNKINLSCKTYLITQNENSFSDLFTDIKKIVIDKKQDRLRIFKT